MVSAAQARDMLAALPHPTIQEAVKQIAEGVEPFKIRATLERNFPPQVCLDLMDCLSSRRRYQDKFWKVENWALTRTAAEQATDSRLARWRSRFLGELAPESRLTELGCGLGGDSVFLAQKFALEAYEVHPARAALAEHNISQVTQPSRPFEIHNRECDVNSLHGDILFCDPARRGQERLTEPEDWLPPLSQVLAAYSEKRFHTVAIKCAPGLRLEKLEPMKAQMSVTFLSICGALKECFLLLNPHESSIRALLFDQAGDPVSFQSLGEDITLRHPKEGDFLHNPDPAVLRAEALDTLARELQAGIVHPKIGYLVGPNPCSTSAAHSFRILEHFRLNWTQLKKRFRATDWTEFEYLGRGVPFSQGDVRKRLGKLSRRKGQTAKKGSLIIYRGESGYQVVLGQRHRQKGKDSL